MFTTDCPHLDREVCILDQQVIALTHATAATAVEFRCPCGGSGVSLTEPTRSAGRLVFHQSKLPAYLPVAA